MRKLFYLSLTLAAFGLLPWAAQPAPTTAEAAAGRLAVQPCGCAKDKEPEVPPPSPEEEELADEADAAAGDLELQAAAADQLPALPPPFPTPLLPGWVPLSIETWWTPATDDHGGWGHIHVDLLEKVGQVVTGNDEDGDADNYVRQIRCMTHNNPSKMKVFRVDLAPGTTIFKQSIKPPLVCKDGNCAYAFTIKIPDGLLGNGDQTMRHRFTGDTPDGKVFTTSSEIQVVAGNGQGGSGHGAVVGQGPTACMGKGWYTGAGYGQIIVDKIETAPVHGTIGFGVMGREGTERLVVKIDNNHEVPAAGIWAYQPANVGITILDTPAKDKQKMAVTVDTTKLANGWHLLSARNFTGKGSVSAGVPGETQPVPGQPDTRQVNVLNGKLSWWVLISN